MASWNKERIRKRFFPHCLIITFTCCWSIFDTWRYKKQTFRLGSYVNQHRHWDQKRKRKAHYVHRNVQLQSLVKLHAFSSRHFERLTLSPSRKTILGIFCVIVYAWREVNFGGARVIPPRQGYLYKQQATPDLAYLPIQNPMLTKFWIVVINSETQLYQFGIFYTILGTFLMIFMRLIHDEFHYLCMTVPDFIGPCMAFKSPMHLVPQWLEKYLVK